MRSVFLAVVIVLTIAAAPGAVEKFPLPDSPIQLEGQPSEARYFDVVGRKAVLMGLEGGEMEAWIWPFKAARNISLEFRREDFAEPLDSRSLAQWIQVRPESTTIMYTGEDFRVAATFFVPLGEPAIAVLLDADIQAPLTVSLLFTPELRPAWPASLGGQYAVWSEDDKAFVLSESRRCYNILVGSPEAVRHYSSPAHRLSETPNRFDIRLDPERSVGSYTPIVLCGGEMERDDARRLYARILGTLKELYAERVEHARSLREDLLSVESPCRQFDLALEWGKVSLDDGLVCNPDLGCGLVAGYGLSGRSERPGFAWYFGGDTFFNQFAISAYGDFPLVRTALELVRANQREDGKIMHELSQGAGMIRWFEDYPYGYYHMETSTYYIVAVMNYVDHSGDVEFLNESWESMLAAYRYAKSIVGDDGLPDSRKGGLGALEVGVLLKDLKTDIYVAGLWVESLRRLRRAAGILGKNDVVPEIEGLLSKAEKTLSERYFIEGQGYHALALAVDGSAVSELTVWPAMPMMFGLLPEDDALATLHRLSSPEIATDYGMRILTNRSEVYEPNHYNNGAVWGFVTGYTAMAQYAYGRPIAGWQLVRGLADETFQGSRGDMAELYSGDFRRPLDAAVGHQLFSTGGFVAPAIRGMLGLLPEATAKTLTFAPQLPCEWESLKIKRAPLGAGRLDVEIGQKPPLYTYRLTPSGASGWRLRFAPSFPVGTEIFEVLVNGEIVEFKVQRRRSSIALDIDLPLDGELNIQVQLARGDQVILPPSSTKPGERSSGLRYLDSWLDEADGTLYYELAGLRGKAYVITHRHFARAEAPKVTEQEFSVPAGPMEFGRILLAIRDGELAVIEGPDGG